MPTTKSLNGVIAITQSKKMTVRLVTVLKNITKTALQILIYPMTISRKLLKNHSASNTRDPSCNSSCVGRSQIKYPKNSSLFRMLEESRTTHWQPWQKGQRRHHRCPVWCSNPHQLSIHYLFIAFKKYTGAHKSPYFWQLLRFHDKWI